MIRPTTLILLSALLTLAAACGVPEDGKLGNLSFTYNGARGSQALSEGILPPGAKLDVRVHQPNQEQSETPTAKITAATSGATEVFGVEGFEGDRVTLKALAQGSAELKIEASLLPGETVAEDAVDITVATPETVELSVSCLDSSEQVMPKFLAYSSVSAAYTLGMKDGRKAIGYGYYPVTSGAMDVSLERSTSGAVVFDAKGPVPKASVTSDFTSNEVLALELVDPAMVDGAKLVTLGSLTVAEKDAYLVVLPSVGGEMMCHPGSNVSVTSLTPDLCTLSVAKGSPFKDLVHIEGILQAQALAAGQCEFEVNYLDGAGMVAATHKLSVEIVAQ